MSPSLFGYVLSLFVMLAFAHFQAFGEGPTDPVLYTESSLVDLGVVRAGEISNATIKVKNIGNGVLTIKNVLTSCGCTSTQVSKPTVQPGSFTEIKVSIVTEGIGRQIDKVIIIESNDPKNPKKLIRFRGNLVTWIKYDPSNLDFVLDGDKSTPPQFVDVATTDWPSGKIEHITKSSSLINVEVSYPTTLKDKCRIRVTANVDDAHVSFVTAAIGVHTNEPSRNIEIPVTISQQGAVKTFPEELLFVEGVGHEQSCTLKILLPELTIRNISVPDPQIHIKSKQDRDGFWLITLDNIPATKALNGEILAVDFTNEKTGRLMVPFRVISR